MCAICCLCMVACMHKVWCDVLVWLIRWLCRSDAYLALSSMPHPLKPGYTNKASTLKLNTNRQQSNLARMPRQYILKHLLDWCSLLQVWCRCHIHACIHQMVQMLISTSMHVIVGWIECINWLYAHQSSSCHQSVSSLALYLSKSSVIQPLPTSTPTSSTPIRTRTHIHTQQIMTKTEQKHDSTVNGEQTHDDMEQDYAIPSDVEATCVARPSGVSQCLYWILDLDSSSDSGLPDMSSFPTCIVQRRRVILHRLQAALDAARMEATQHMEQYTHATQSTQYEMTSVHAHSLLQLLHHARVAQSCIHVLLRSCCSPACGSIERVSDTYTSCTRCYRVVYCSRACQLTHWTNEHQHSCQAREKMEWEQESGADGKTTASGELTWLGRLHTVIQAGLDVVLDDQCASYPLVSCSSSSHRPSRSSCVRSLSLDCLLALDSLHADYWSGYPLIQLMLSSRVLYSLRLTDVTKLVSPEPPARGGEKSTNRMTT